MGHISSGLVYELRVCMFASLCNLLCRVLVVLCSVVVVKYSIGYIIRTVFCSIALSTVELCRPL